MTKQIKKCAKHTWVTLDAHGSCTSCVKEETIRKIQAEQRQRRRELELAINSLTEKLRKGGIKGKEFLKKQLNYLLVNSINTGDTKVTIGEYSGGGDSGYVELVEDGLLLEFDDKYSIDDFNELLYEATGHGSFAGEFECHGYIYWTGEKLQASGSISYTSWENDTPDPVEI